MISISAIANWSITDNFLFIFTLLCAEGWHESYD